MKNTDLTKKFDLLFLYPNLRETIQKKMKTLGITAKQLCEEAQEIGIKGLNPSSISRFFADKKGKREGSITQGVLIYILFRLGFHIDLKIFEDSSMDPKEKSAVFAKQFVQ